MNAIAHLSTARTYRRISAAAIAHYAATDSQAARLAAVGDTRSGNRSAPTVPLWDDGLLARLSQPLSRVRE